MPEEKDQWYSNKDLFEMIQKLVSQMSRTEQIIKKYNGLHEKVQCHEDYIKEQQGKGSGRQSVEAAFLRWGGWLVGLAGFVYAMSRGCGA